MLKQEMQHQQKPRPLSKMYPTSLAHELSQILEGTQKAEQSEYGSDMKRFNDGKIMIVSTSNQDEHSHQPTNMNSCEYR